METMKKLTPKRKLRLIRTARRRERNRKRKYRRKEHKINNPGYFTIQAPGVFKLTESKNRAAVLRFLHALREKVLKDNKAVLVDFVNTRKMWSDATLLFRAELCRIKKISAGKVLMKCAPPRNRKVAEVLRQTGIYRLLSFHAKARVDFEDVIHWNHADGTGADGKKYDDLLGRYDGTISETLAEGLYLGLTEAMTNCHHHAYIAPRGDGLNHQDEEKDWWMFSQEKDGWLSVVFCDLGVGIPETFPRNRPAYWRRLLQFGVPDDGVVIEEAIKESRSRTGMLFRGKGLKQLIDTIDRFPDGTLAIHSNRGWYTYNKGKGETRTATFGSSVMGTLIFWRVPLPLNAEQMYERNRDQYRQRIF